MKFYLSCVRIIKFIRKFVFHAMEYYVKNKLNSNIEILNIINKYFLLIKYKY